jgi:hypothetical protein
LSCDLSFVEGLDRWVSLGHLGFGCHESKSI